MFMGESASVMVVNKNKHKGKGICNSGAVKQKKLALETIVVLWALRTESCLLPFSTVYILLMG